MDYLYTKKLMEQIVIVRLEQQWRTLANEYTIIPWQKQQTKIR